MNGVLTAPDVRERVRSAGFDIGGGAPADAEALVRAEVARYGAVIATADIRAE